MTRELTKEEYETIDSVCRVFACQGTYQFPGQTEDDIYQEGFKAALEAAERYDNGNVTNASFRTYIYSCVRNALMNHKRNKYERKGTLTDNKKKINDPDHLPVGVLSDLDYFETIDSSDLFNVLDDKIPSDLRDDWNKMISGLVIKNKQKEKILKVVKQVLDGLQKW